MAKKARLKVLQDPKTGRRHWYFDGERISAASLRAAGPERVKLALSLLPEEDALRLAAELMGDWAFWARDNQLVPDGEWSTCLVLAGRGFGKSRMGAQAVLEWHAQGFRYINIIGATSDDAWDIMVDGESGILAYAPAHIRPTKKRHERKLVWPNGAETLVFTADEPERLRGKQSQKIWADELCAWRYPESWDQLVLGLRLRAPADAHVKTPQAIITTTPKPTRLLRDIIADPTTIVIRGKTDDNIENLAPTFVSKLRAKYEGTRLGRQELNAEVLEDNPGALWTRACIDATRHAARFTETSPPRLIVPAMRRVVVGVDPAAAANPDSDETGIVVAGLGMDGRGYVLEDVTSEERLTPEKWASRAIDAYHRWNASRIVAETNQGGAMVEGTFRAVAKNIPFKGIHATDSKYSRAEPVAALYEQGRVSHIGAFPKLEDQMCEYNRSVDKWSPDRLDALVYALTELMLGPEQFATLEFYEDQVRALMGRSSEVKSSVSESVVLADQPPPSPALPEVLDSGHEGMTLKERMQAISRAQRQLEAATSSDGQPPARALQSADPLAAQIKLIESIFGTDT